MIRPEWNCPRYEHHLVLPGELLPDLAAAEALCVDVETRPRQEFLTRKKAGLHHKWAELLGVSVAVPPTSAGAGPDGVGSPGQCWYLPLRHAAPGSINLDVGSALAWLQGTLDEVPDRTLVNHHLKFDIKMLASDGVEVPRGMDLWCTMGAAELLDERLPFYGLKPLTAKYLGMPAAEEAIKNRYLKRQKKDFQDWSCIPVDILAPYGCSDVERALRLAAWQQPRLEAEDLARVHAMERKFTRTLVDSELRGIRVDLERLSSRSKVILNEATELEARLEKLTGVSFDPDSIMETADVVANLLGLRILHYNKPTERNPYGQAKFDDMALLDYMRTYPERAEIFWLIRKLRRLYHNLGSFILPYLTWQHGGVLYSTFNQIAARTGRMTSDSPNLQQVSDEETYRWFAPDRSLIEEWTAPGAREFFIPRDGHALLFIDESQIEYRLFAHYTGSPRLIEAYNNDPTLDMHRWASEVALEGLLPRDSAKNTNFGIVYGMGESKLVRQMSTEDRLIDEAEGRRLLNKYYDAVPELRPLQRNVAKVLKYRGFVRTVLGRKRRSERGAEPETVALLRTEQDRTLKDYKALNAICQGSGADVLKKQALESDRWCRETGLAQQLLTIHDELVFEAPVDRWREAARGLKPVLENFRGHDNETVLKVPTYVNVKVATERWSESTKVDAGSLTSTP